MASATPVATLLQISDLHFGELDANGDARHFPGISAILKHVPMFEGLLGHHFRALAHLHDFYWKLRGQGENPVLIVTGDVTRTGNGNEFDTADDFLVSSLLCGNKCVGLQSQTWRQQTVSGNHDTWPGTFAILGGPTQEYFVYFPRGTFPFDLPIPLPGGRLLRLLGINSDADVNPVSLERLLAHGCFGSQLNTLNSQLNGSEEGEVRVIVMHHSPAHRGVFLQIDHVCRQQLGAFANANGVRLLLSGHIHEPLLQPCAILRSGAQPVFEARCGTTTQLDVVPANRLHALFGKGAPRRRCYNSLILHRLYDSDDGLLWTAEHHVRGLTGFQSDGALQTVRL